MIDSSDPIDFLSVPRRVALVGHRGVGKTTLLSRIESCYRAVQANVSPEKRRRVKVVDLDREIAQSSGRSVSSIFHEDGEAVFRRLEGSTLMRLEKEFERSVDDVFVALGAGYAVETLSSKWHVIWVRRASDDTGRIFTDRPRLEPGISALDEFAFRRDARTPRYAGRADDVWFLDEGDLPDPAFRDLLFGTFRRLGGALTILPENFARDFSSWAARRVAWGIEWFELRDDLLSEAQMREGLRVLPREKVLLSFREVSQTETSRRLVEDFSLAFDWPLERGSCPFGEPAVLSQHQLTASFEQTLAGLARASVARAHEPDQRTDRPILKAALPVENFQELIVGHRWYLEDPAHRAFLPTSGDGRWNWYRQLTVDQPISFFRESGGSALDQPTVLQWARARKLKKQAEGDIFSAVLGDPVSHSRTPNEQAEFFRRRGEMVYAIRITEPEWRAGAVKSLYELGLRSAAVTAPLKKLAFELCTKTDSVAKRLRAVNTLWFASATEIAGINTDLEGLNVAAREIGVHQPAVVWGGGGTLDVVKDVFPKASLVSVRTGLIRETNEVAPLPDLVIWAAPLKISGTLEATAPPRDWKPKTVFDLNYSEASLARAYAAEVGAKYISGLAMFRAQAQAQREFWERCLLGESK